MARIVLLIAIIFAFCAFVVWMMAETNYFNFKRLFKIAKYFALGFVVLLATLLMFSFLVEFDHLF